MNIDVIPKTASFTGLVDQNASLTGLFECTLDVLKKVNVKENHKRFIWPFSH
jgi:hypothetical protein